MIDRGEAIRKLALNVARFTGLAPLARPFVGGVGAILMLHRVTATPERPKGVNRHLNISPDFLDALIGDMKASGYRFVTLDEAVAGLGGSPQAGRFATITADDAYRDNLTEALPVLERHGAPITIYVAPALIDGGAYLWWDVIDDLVEANAELRVPMTGRTVVLPARTAAEKFAANTWLHEFLTGGVAEKDQHAFMTAFAAEHGGDPDAPRRKTLMDWSEIGAASAHPLVTIGAHTIHHFNLRRLSDVDARIEISGAADIIEARTGIRPHHMAYPYGYSSAVSCREVALAREAGFASAVTTRHGVLRNEHAGHLHALPRISINGRYQRLAHVRTMLSGVTTPLANSGKMVVTV